MGTDRFRKRFQPCGIEVGSWLIGVRLDGVDIDLEIRGARLVIRQSGNQRAEPSPKTSPPCTSASPGARWPWGFRLIKLRREIAHQDHHLRSFNHRAATSLALTHPGMIAWAAVQRAQAQGQVPYTFHPAALSWAAVSCLPLGAATA